MALVELARLTAPSARLATRAGGSSSRKLKAAAAEDAKHDAEEPAIAIARAPLLTAEAAEAEAEAAADEVAAQLSRTALRFLARAWDDRTPPR